MQRLLVACIMLIRVLPLRLGPTESLPSLFRYYSPQVNVLAAPVADVSHISPVFAPTDIADLYTLSAFPPSFTVIQICNGDPHQYLEPSML